MSEWRPRSLAELPFPRHAPVQWFSPSELVRTGVHAGLSAVFGAYADKREVQASLPVLPFHDHSDAAELWLDYVSDLGDGFDATASVAVLLGRDKLLLGEGGPALPRGSVLVMGGDEVYPAATARAYEERTKGPYRAALPCTDDPPTLYAVPGNHDWYDGLTSWLRFFCQGGWVGGWRTVQRRSYFAARLPHGWWLLGLDIAHGSYLDGPQLDHFRAVAAQIGPEDGVVVCTGKPSWLGGGRDRPEDFATLDHFLHRVLPDPGQVRLLLSGDLHHYARYEEVGGGGRQLVTCGGGGAYLSATHGRRGPLLLPPAALHRTETDPPEQARYELAATYPSVAESRRLARGVLTRLGTRNPGFVGLLVGVQALLAAAAAASRAALAVAAVLLLGACVASARAGGSRRPLLPAALHALGHLAATAAAVLLASRLPLGGWPDAAADTARLAVAGVVGGVASTVVVAVYLWLSAGRGHHLNDVFSAQALEDHKSFLRLHVGADGDLTLHALAVPRVCRSWTVPPAGRPGDPWIVPAEPLVARLVEPPVRIARRSSP